MSGIYQIRKLQLNEKTLAEEIDSLSSELRILKSDLKGQFVKMKQNKKNLEFGSIDLNFFYSEDFQKEKLKEKKELDKLMKEYNKVHKSFKKARVKKRIPSRMDYEKATFDE